MVIALFEVDIPIDHAPFGGGEQDSIGFNRPGWENDHSGANAAIMSNTTA
jgi:hypothetical protein